MSAKPTEAEIAKAQELMDGAGALIPRALAASITAQAFADAREQGRESGIREAARISPCYWDLDLSLRQRLEEDILNLLNLNVPQGDES